MHKIIKNILWLLTEHGVRMALGLVVAGVMARQLGVEQYGLFQYALGLVAVFFSISFICGAELLVPISPLPATQNGKALWGMPVWLIVADLGRGYSGFSPEWYIFMRRCKKYKR